MAWWKKPSGLKVETNDEPATIEHCEAIGWKRIKAQKPAAEEPQPDEEPVAVAEEPVAVAEEPVAVAEEPVAVAEEPMTETAPAEEPVAEEPRRRRAPAS